ncbi:hypothetical protein AAF712_016321, partial [Marasmius tenuissimus]
MAYPCSSCKTVFGSANGLRQHEKVCEKEKEAIRNSTKVALARQNRRKRKQEEVEAQKRVRQRTDDAIPTPPIGRSTASPWLPSGLPLNPIEFPLQQSRSLQVSQPPSPPPPIPGPEPQSPPRLPMPPPMLRPSGLPERTRRLPKRFRHDDPLPEAAPAVPSPSDSAVPSRLPRIRLIIRDTLRTLTNKFGLLREYLHRPTHDADLSVPIEELANYHWRGEGGFVKPPEVQTETSTEPPWPFKSMAVHLLMKWANTGGSAKTYSEMDRLAAIISRPDFNPNDLIGFNAKRESRRLDTARSNTKSTTYLNNFSKASIDIDVPSGEKDVPPQKFAVNGLYYRDLLETIKAAFAHPLSLKFHLSPFKLFHVSDVDDEPTRVYSELYNSDAFIKEHDNVQRSELPPGSPTCK